MHLTERIPLNFPSKYVYQIVVMLYVRAISYLNSYLDYFKKTSTHHTDTDTDTHTLTHRKIHAQNLMHECLTFGWK